MFLENKGKSVTGSISKFFDRFYQIIYIDGMLSSYQVLDLIHVPSICGATVMSVVPSVCLSGLCHYCGTLFDVSEGENGVLLRMSQC